MAATFTNAFRAGRMPTAPRFLDRYNLTFAASDYPTGGYTLGIAALLPGKTIVAVQARGKTTSTGAWDTRDWFYNAVTDKLMAFVHTTAVEVAAAVDVSLTTVELYIESE